jgi:type I site-specific restriction endonuclease
MQALNLPETELRIREQGDKKEIFDGIRKKFIALTAEEWVRQHFIAYLISAKNVPATLIGVEVSLKMNRLQKRGDIVVYDKSGKPCLIVECKAPEIRITQDVFDQVARYNMTLNVNYLVVTNGLEHFACFINHEKSEYKFLREIPDFSDLK